jgi:hypothetical protein
MKKSTLFRILLPIIMMVAGTTVKAQVAQLSDLTGALAVYCPAEAVKLHGASTGTTYTWLRYPGKDLTGTPTTLTSTTADLSDAPPSPGYYTYVSTSINTNNCTSDQSDPTTIYALPHITAPLSGPANTCVSALASTVLTVAPVSTESAIITETFVYTYQWLKNGTAITGATSPSYTLDPVKDAAVGSQTFTVNVFYAVRPSCAAVSNSQAVLVQANPTKPTVTIVP